MTRPSITKKDSAELQAVNCMIKENPPELSSNLTDESDLSGLSEMSRKQFLALLAASAAFAAAGCSEYLDKGEIVPYTKKPEEVNPGVPNYYASTCTCCPQACGILIKTREGRPIKIDGNPDHPINRGKICARGQASILNLYDPSRLRSPIYGKASGRKGELSWEEVDIEVAKCCKDAVKEGKEIALITRNVFSPTTKKILDDFKKRYPTTKIYSYSLFNNETRKRAWQKCYGSFEIPVIQWEKAKIILALEADFLGTDDMVMEQVRHFTNGRDFINSQVGNRLYCAESSMSLTGANADYRLKIPPAAQLDFALVLLREVSGNEKIFALSIKEFAEKYNLPLGVLDGLVTDLKKFKGETIVFAGNLLPEPVHIAVNYLNDILGNTKLYKQNQTSVTVCPLSSPDDFDTLVGGMKSGQVGVLIHFDSNPVYHLPKEFEYGNALKFVPLSVSMTESNNETSQLCTYILPVNHMLESWGDSKIRTGIIGLQQPVIMPLYNSRQKENIILSWINGNYVEAMYHDCLMQRWEEEVYQTLGLRTDFKSFWYSTLHDGVLEFEESIKNKLNIKRNMLPSTSYNSASMLSVILTESCYLGDGSDANNGWLQELPHPISKIVWDNYAAISKKTAAFLNVNNNDLIRVKLNQGAVILPVFIQYGQADNVISVSLGYGRTCTGPVGINVGVGVNSLLEKKSIIDTKIFEGASIEKFDGKYELVMIQELHSPEDKLLGDLHHGRRIIRSGTVEEYQKNPGFLRTGESELINIAKGVEYKGVKWAMAIDLNKCIGCNACVVGCTAENNVPVVGKEQTGMGRSMHWIRIDRYYSGTEDSPLVDYQPMLCQHCDNAPCENVCPVVATNHSPDGLNQMVYNRCVGTKYCSNNCPYKVRRFNFFNWRNDFEDGYFEKESLKLVYNPEVTVRSRGVMEKCTFCIQKIMEARQHAKEQGRKLKGADVKTACQEACPASAIEFGDMNDPGSTISAYRRHDLAYYVLEETNVRPNVTYIAKLRNIFT